MTILETLAPIFILIAVGAALSRLQFLGREFMADLNRLVFWVAMPALLFHSASRAAGASAQTWWLVGVLLAATLLIALVAWIASLALAIPPAGRGTLVQAAFRGNLAFIGVPVIAATFPAGPAGLVNPSLTTAVIAMTLTMAFYNALAILVLQASRSAEHPPNAGLLVREVVTNPLLVAGLLGLTVGFLGLTVPRFLDRTLETLAGAAVPLALLGPRSRSRSSRPSSWSWRGRWGSARSSAALRWCLAPARRRRPPTSWRGRWTATRRWPPGRWP
jgi:hypothetical protein